ncbi:hypothetical protein EV193_108257 [Herbihabitans rhizosphaerae]|uniref:Uncharacterized protein n=1 Tax=Herbihabitans rhizosphaerae TaxID=1872711 RepID=A0A4V2ES27_9PSEU|nr:hypothetical protein [Herbihabitans rhizosphaerae]RZS34907.1 hypothetical protein EV193_108257 [Herbihabitans rhizosphaerae]
MRQRRIWGWIDTRGPADGRDQDRAVYLEAWERGAQRVGDVDAEDRHILRSID